MVDDSILILGDAGVERYRSMASAEKAIEAADVRAGIYSAYDMAGRRLEINVMPTTPRLGLFPSSERVVITPSSESAVDAGALLRALRDRLACAGATACRDYGDVSARVGEHFAI